MKVRSALRRVCKDCYFVRRNGTMYVYCKRMPKHKQRQGFHTSCPCCASGVMEPAMAVAPPAPFFYQRALGTAQFARGWALPTQHLLQQQREQLQAPPPPRDAQWWAKALRDTFYGPLARFLS